MPTETESNVSLPAEELFLLIIKALNEVLSSSNTVLDHPLNEKEAADLIGIRPQTLAVWRTKETGPSYYLAGRNVRYLREDIFKFIEQNKVGR